MTRLLRLSCWWSHPHIKLWNNHSVGIFWRCSRFLVNIYKFKPEDLKISGKIDKAILH